MAQRQLFRQEAIDAQREKLLGAVSAARPVPLRVFTALAASIAIALGAYAFWGEYTRRERVEGFLATDVGAARVLAPKAARIDELLVKEGEEVKAGAPLAKITFAGEASAPKGEIQEQLQRVEAEIATAKQLARQEEDQVRTRIAGLSAELDQSAGEVEFQKSRVGSGEEEYNKATELQKKGFYSDADVLRKKNDMLEQQGRLQTLKRQRTALERELANARSELTAVQIRLSEKISRLQRTQSELRSTQQVDETRSGTTILAPTAGVVTNIAVARGDSVAPDAPIATVLPKGSLRAQLLVPTRAAGFIREGNAVVLRYDAFPFQRFGQYRGQVADVSRTVWSPGERVGPMLAREPVYRVDVNLERQTVMAGGTEMSLRPGMTVSADILLEKRTIFEWVFEPVLELRGRLQ